MQIQVVLPSGSNRRDLMPSENRFSPVNTRSLWSELIALGNQHFNVPTIKSLTPITVSLLPIFILKTPTTPSATHLTAFLCRKRRFPSVSSLLATQKLGKHQSSTHSFAVSISPGHRCRLSWNHWRGFKAIPIQKCRIPGFDAQVPMHSPFSTRPVEGNARVFTRSDSGFPTLYAWFRDGYSRGETAGSKASFLSGLSPFIQRLIIQT
jgi:hypothetical protein